MPDTPRRIPPLLEGSLGFNVYRCALLFRRELVRALARYRMTPEQWQVLAVLDEAGSTVSQSEIVRLVMKDKPTVTRILQRMERDGWISRRTAVEDARVTRIEMTPAGAKLCARIPVLLTRRVAPIYQQLGAESYGRLMADLKRLRRLMGDSPT